MSNDGSHVTRRRRRARSRPARIVVVVIATVALAGAAAGCTGSSSTGRAGGAPHATASTNSSSAVAYSACMRTHGVANYPDPDSEGHLTKGGAQQLGVSSSQFEAAQRACADLFPNIGGSFMDQFHGCVEGGVCPQALVQQALTLMRNLAQCLRSHGVPNWPDPTISSRGAPFFDASGAGLTHAYTHSAAVESKIAECERQVGGSTGVPVLLG